ncbi:MAG: P-loop NTPase fold protein [Rhodobacteraceae bacterium]|nr:P-loop NTPase fold protein [Paracoccaceae bacterium]MCY4139242.1 P-loop NTPase fold protein [Paracoccaceae bacterium]
MHNHQPLPEGGKDRLGFSKTAKHLANAILENDLSGGFVIGVEGTWGSGKTSLVNLALRQIQQCKNNNKPQIIEFKPWLVGERKDLLKELFNQIAGVVKNVVDDAEAIRAKNLLRVYSQVASGIGGLAEIAAVFEVPLANKVKRFFKATGVKAGELAETSLRDVKNDLKQTLAKSKAPIVIFVDDLDRLDPEEAVEVLRLIRVVADFPNIAYVVAYDSVILAENIKTALEIENGEGYIEKVVQVSFRMPEPLRYDLIGWFEEEAARLLIKDRENTAQIQRFRSAIHNWAPVCLSTPRDVVRTFSSLKLYAKPIPGRFDPGDMVFLQLIRLRMPSLYKWVENYVYNLSMLGDGYFIPPGVPERAGKELLKAIEGDSSRKSDLVDALAKILPGIDMWAGEQDSEGFKVYSGLSPDEMNFLSQEMRLASRNHFRRYFSFDMPDGYLSDTEVIAFINIAKTNKKLALDQFTKKATEKRPQGGVMGEVLLSRILERQSELDVDDIRAVFNVLGKGMDVLAANAPGPWGHPSYLTGERGTIFGIIEQLNKADRKTILQDIFRPGTSYSWLSGIIRSSTFEHGLAGDRAKPEENRLLNSSEFEMIRQLYLDMIHNEDPATLLGVFDFLDFLYSWFQLGDEQKVLEWVASQSNTDEDLLSLLDRMAGSVSDLTPHLKPQDLQSFFDDIATIEKRVTAIAEDQHQTLEVREKANKVLGALQLGREKEALFPS